jgi:hypothetical protein
MNNILLNDQWVIVEIREEIKMKTQPTRTYGTQQGSPKRKVSVHGAYIKRTERSQ